MNFFIQIDHNSPLPLYKKVALALKESIDSGRLQEGNALPSTRQLSVHLGVSRITVVQSYEQLISQGYLRVVTGTGTFVSKKAILQTQNRKTDFEISLDTKNITTDQNKTVRRLSNYCKRLLHLETQTEHENSQDPSQSETEFGQPPTALLPQKQWQKLLVKHCSTISDKSVSSAAILGCLPLQEAIARYLGRSRNITCSPENIAIFASAQQSVSLLMQLLLNEGDSVAVENPGFIGARRIIKSLGAHAVSINVDNNGMNIDDLTAKEQQFRAVYLTPNRQDPLGVSLSQERRHELLLWAKISGSYIIEDDYDCEFSYNQFAPALQSLDRDESVIYLSSFWKVLFPIMPIGFMVAPPHLIPALTRAKRLNEQSFSLPEQLALAEFINQGLLEKHISRTQKQLTKCRQELTLALTRTFGKTITISKQSAGMHIIVQFENSDQNNWDNIAICAAAQRAGLTLISSKSYYLSGEKNGQFLISFAKHQGQDLALLVAKFASFLKDN